MKLIPITPKHFGAQMKALPAAVKKGMRQAAEKVREDFDSTTEGWGEDVEFTIREDGDSLIIDTANRIWHLVNEGTRPHVIVGHGKMLRFTAGGTPKTRPGRIKASAGAPGSAVVIRPRVNHPGTEARDFSGTIGKRWQRGVAPFIRSAIEEVLR